MTCKSKLKVKNSSLVIKNLSHTYDKNKNAKLILNSIDLRVDKGELLGLLGPSGCGKTTLLRLIAGFEIPQNGKIFLEHNLISSPESVTSPEKRKIGMVFQDYALFPHLTVYENAKFGLIEKKNTDRVDYLLKVLDIEFLRDRYPHELSGGQKQRLAIARALAPGTSFLLLDEPFCSLDLNVRLKLRSELPNILKSFGASGLMVTHDPEEAMAICDKVAVMNDGFIHQYDAPFELINNPKTLFVSRFILGNNTLKIKIEDNYIKTCIGKLKLTNFPKSKKNNYLSISPKSISIKKSINGNAKVVAKEFLGDFFIYKVLIGEDELRVRASLDNKFSIGEKCNVCPIKKSEFFIYPGSYVNKII